MPTTIFWSKYSHDQPTARFNYAILSSNLLRTDKNVTYMPAKDVYVYSSADTTMYVLDLEFLQWTQLWTTMGNMPDQLNRRGVMAGDNMYFFGSELYPSNVVWQYSLGKDG